MAESKHFRTGHCVSLKRLAVSALALCVSSALLAAGTALPAAPVTFAFDADVVSVSPVPTSNVGLPFDVNVGDVIHGKFSFEPSPVGSIGRQDTGIEFRLRGLVLKSPSFDISFADRQIPPIMLTDPTADPLEAVDSIYISCSSLPSQTQCSPDIVPGSVGVHWRPFMSLHGPSPIFTSYDLVGDTDFWNVFANRSLDLHFVSQMAGTTVSALIGPMTVVPEPTALFAAFTASILLIAASSRWRRCVATLF